MRPSPFCLYSSRRRLSERVVLRHPLLLKRILCVVALQRGGLDPGEQCQSERGCLISPMILFYWNASFQAQKHADIHSLWKTMTKGHKVRDITYPVYMCGTFV